MRKLAFIFIVLGIFAGSISIYALPVSSGFTPSDQVSDGGEKISDAGEKEPPDGYDPPK